MLRFAVVGNPVSHSKSPQIHSLFAEQTGKQLHYAREEVTAEQFDNFVEVFFAGGGSGLNITVPFKEKAFSLADIHSERAQLARAVNTLYQDKNRRLCGDNTDGIGLVRDLCENHGITIRDKRLLILGAGGAVRGALGSLAGESPESITLVNRTRSRADTLKEEFFHLVPMEVISYGDQIDNPFDIVINGTSTGLQGDVPPLSTTAVSPDSSCYDMMYSSVDTAFVAWARQQGVALALDGLGMLVEQAAESFTIWLGTRPSTADVIGQIRAGLS